jgi:hypothetical protein
MRRAGIVDQAVGVVGVQVGDHDVGDVRRLDAGRAQVLRQLAEGGLHGIAGAGVDEDCSAAATDQKIIHRDIERSVLRFADQAFGLRALHADDEVERGPQHTVAQSLHLHVANAHAGQCRTR